MSVFAWMSRLLRMQGVSLAIFSAVVAVACGQQRIAVSGMSEYTDTAFGYSFWHPSSWKIKEEPVASPDHSGWFQGGRIVKTLRVAEEHPSEDDSPGLMIEVFSSTAHSIIELGHSRSASPVGIDQKYFYDGKRHTWMYSSLSGSPNGGPPSTSPAKISNYTMGGLPILEGAARFGADSIIPLSTDRFLVLTVIDPGDGCNQVIAPTIMLLKGGKSATISDPEQISAVHREGVLLKALASPLGDFWYIDSQHVYDRKGNPIPDVDPSAFRLLAKDGLGSLFATNGRNVYSEYGVIREADPATFKPLQRSPFATDARHVYTDDGAVVAAADPATFRILSNEGWGPLFATDGKRVYTMEGALVPGTDPATFKPFPHSPFATDSKHVYNEEGAIVPRADPATFGPLADKNLVFFMTDGKHVYTDLGALVPDANPATLKEMAKLGPGSSFMTDGKHVYTIGGALLPDADPATFKPISDSPFARDDRHVYTTGGVLIPGANPATFHQFSEDDPGSSFATDGKHVYTAAGVLIPGADPASFVAIDDFKAKDARHDYSWHDGRLFVNGAKGSK